ncbi:MAG: hypothetical protein CGU28_09140 [Candidatus Dactylopiibacterium carminicum]|nr:MAG: hypothetical protein CGU28_09140 [Candidatus Dactylopiibacterium carminicum]
MAMLLGAGAALWLAWVGIRLRPRKSGDALDRLWSRFCRRLARAGVARQAWEAPTDYAHRAGLALPAGAATIAVIAEQ